MDDADKVPSVEKNGEGEAIESEAVSENCEHPEETECSDEHKKRFRSSGTPTKSITFPLPSDESLDYMAKAADGANSLRDYSSVISEKNEQFLAIRDAIRQSFGANSDFALLVQSMKIATAEYASMALDVSEAIKPTLEYAQMIGLQAQDAMQNAMESVSVVLDYMAIANKTFSEYWDNCQHIAQALTPMVEALRATRLFYNFDELKSRNETWGEFGWVLFDEMPSSIAKMKPESWKQANKIARTCIDGDVIDNLFESLRAIVAKRNDLDEAVALFRERRYKPCAMMVCSLIECCLYKRSKRQEGQNERRVKEPLRRLEDQLPEVGYAVLSLLGTYKAFDYFFKFANDFDREREGELNRNFLMHGMMYQKVTRIACVKLFMLLLSVERLMRTA